MTDEDDYRSRAREMYGSDEIEIDSDATVSVGDDGAFVQAWVWVPNDEEESDDEAATQGGA